MAWTCHRRIGFGDVDAAGIAFTPRLIALAHEAYEGALAAAGLPLARVLTEGRWLLPLVHVEADFSAPLPLGAEAVLTVHAVPGGRSYRITCVLADAATGGTCATVTTVHVCLPRSGGPAMALPEELLAALVAIGGPEPGP